MTLRAWLACLLTLAPLAAQDVVDWSASAQPDVVHPGEVAMLELTATMDEGWHIYAAAQESGGPVATSFSAADGAPEALGALREPQPDQHHDEGFNIQVLTHEGTVTLRQPFRVPADAAPGELTLAGEVRYQACTDRSCLPPADEPVSATVTVAAGPVRADYAAAPPETPYEVAVAAADPTAPTGAAEPGAGVAESAADEARAQGLGAFLLVAFLAGLAALLTPCVFPMIPITVSFFTKQAGDSSGKRIGLASAYGLGIVGMYTGLGLLLALTMGAAGAQRVAASPVMNLFFATLFVVFAFSLFGYFELQLPPSLLNTLSRMGTGGGYAGALFMGLTLTLAAFTCTVQFVGGVLVWAANGEWLWPILGMLSFSAAFALPFFLLALFPQYLATLPKSGGWLESTKVVLGFIEIGAALKFLSNSDLVWSWQLLTREVVLALWAAVALLTALYLWGHLRISHYPMPERVGRGRQWAGLMFLLLTGYFLWGLTGARIGGVMEALLPPPDYGRGPAHTASVEEAWVDDYDAALAQARETGRNVFVDFTGVTCTNCRWMEQNMFPQPAVAEKMERYVLARLYTDTGPNADRYREMQIDEYGTASLPYYAIVTPDGETIATFDGMTRDVEEFAEFLERGL